MSSESEATTAASIWGRNFKIYVLSLVLFMKQLSLTLQKIMALLNVIIGHYKRGPHHTI
jgi:hypothetical protein